MSGRRRRLAALVACGAALAACTHGRPRPDALPPSGSVGETARYGPGLLAIDPSGGLVTFELAAEAEVVVVAVAPDGKVRPLYPFAPGESSRFTTGRHTVTVPVTMEWVPAPGTPQTSVAAREMERQQAYQRCLAALRPRQAGQGTTRTTRDSTAGRTTTAPATDVGRAYASDVEACGNAPTGGAYGLGSPGAFEARNDLVVLVASSTPFDVEALRRRLTGVRVRNEADLRALPPWIAGARREPWAGYYSRRR